MLNENERERGTARAMLDQFKVRDCDVQRAVIDGLTAAGFDVELAPGFDLDNPLAEVVQRGAILTVYRKVG